jgi:hypothetical protein
VRPDPSGNENDRLPRSRACERYPGTWHERFSDCLCETGGVTGAATVHEQMKFAGTAHPVSADCLGQQFRVASKNRS